MAERKGKVKSREVEFGLCPFCRAETTEPYISGGEVNVCPSREVGGCGRRFRVFIVEGGSEPEPEPEAED